MSPKQIGNRRRRERGNEWDHTVPDSRRLRVNAPHDLVSELRLVTRHRIEGGFTEEGSAAEACQRKEASEETSFLNC
jgi:hypothetical protein